MDDSGEDDTGEIVDIDGDGFSAGEDCDDENANAYPGADEVCDGLDNNCDGNVDEDSAIDVSTWYADPDEDGFGDASTSTGSCDQPEGYVEDNTDCDSSDGDNYPGADEFCDGVDNNCDDEIDEDSAVDVTTWYRDADDDGYGRGNIIEEACDQPSGFVEESGDCNDLNDQVYPGAEEVIDDLDNDCDGEVDEDGGGGGGSDTAIWRREVWGDATVSIAGSTWSNGTETWSFVDLTNNADVCTAEFETESTDPLTTCADCSFAFMTHRSNLTHVAGDCDAFGWPETSGDLGFDFGFGFTGTYTVEYNGNEYDYNNALMYYYDGSGGAYAAQWFMISYDVSSFSIGSGQFDYELFPYDFYYYPY